MMGTNHQHRPRCRGGRRLTTVCVACGQRLTLACLPRDSFVTWEPNDKPTCSEQLNMGEFDDKHRGR
eukprot:969679-Prorocentrum_minimum.AAC.1